MLLPVAFDVERGHSKEIGLVAEEPQALVAPLAEELPRRPLDMIVIEVLRTLVAAYGAPVLLSSPQVRNLPLRQPIRAIEVRLAVRRPVARATATTEPR